MNPRERNLLIALITVVGLGVILIGGYYWFWAPLEAYKRTISDMRTENNKVQVQIDEFNRDKKKLAMARIKSLPSMPNEASTEYVNYLHSMLPRAGLRVEAVTPAQQAIEVKPVSSIQNIKKTGHQILTFTVKARGTMANLAAALAEFQNTPYEHRIKNMTIDRADTTTKDESAKLIINMMIETLLVAKAESKPGVPPGVDIRGALFDSVSSHYNLPTAGLGQVFASMYYQQTKLPETSRKYAEMAKRNIFVGETVITKTIPFKEKEVVLPPPPPKSPGPIPQYVRLVGIETNTGEAHYLNLFYRKDERKISEKENSGYNTFLIASEDKTYTFMFGKVLKVEHRDVFFQVKDKVYKWHLGDTLAAAWDEGRNYLSLDFLDAADVEPDFAWAKQELEKDKESSKGKIPPKKGFVKGGKGK